MEVRYSLVSLLVGVILALPAALFLLVFDESPARAATVALLLFLPFAVYAVHVDADPPTLFPPRWTLVGGGVLGATLVVLTVLDDPSAATLAVGALTAALSLGYHARYAPTPLPAVPLVVGSGAFAIVVGGVAAVVATPLAGGIGVAAVAAATVDYCREWGYLTRPTRRVAATVALVGGMGVVVAGVLADRATTGIALASALLVVGAALAVE